MSRARKLFILAVILLGLQGAAVVIFDAWSQGPGMSADSASYISAARSLAQGRGLTTFDKKPMVLWPPLFPALLAGIDFVAGVDPVFSIPFVNALCFALLIVISALWILRVTGDRWASMAGALAMLTSIPLLFIARMAWSETLFIFLVTASMAALDLFLDSQKRALLLVSAVCAGLACLTRYVGVVLVVSLIMALAVDPRLGARKKAGAVIAFILACVPLGLWMLRNLHLTGTLTGPRYPTVVHPSAALTRAFEVLLGWFIPKASWLEPMPLAFLLPLAFFCLAALLAWKSRKHPRGLWTRLFPLAVFVCLYYAWLVFASSTVAMDAISPRLMSPVYAPCIMLILFCARVEDGPDSSKKRRRTALMLIGVSIWLLYPATWSYAISIKEIGQGYGYSTHIWRRSPTIRYIRNYLRSETIYSNDPYVLYLLAGLDAREAPFKHPYNSPAPNRESLQDFLAHGEGAVLVWFRQGAPRYYIPAELSKKVRLEKMNDFKSHGEIPGTSDGIIYRIGPRKDGGG